MILPQVGMKFRVQSPDGFASVTASHAAKRQSMAEW